MPYLDIINACAYNVYQALYREPGDEARVNINGRECVDNARVEGECIITLSRPLLTTPECFTDIA